MNVVVMGLSPREEAALGIFLDRSMKSWTWQSAPAQRDAVLPKADLFVADMVSLGMAKRSEKNEADLLRIFQGVPAVLLLPSNDRTWASMNVSAATHPLIWLPRPYGTGQMQSALEKAAASVSRTAPGHVPAPIDQAQSIRSDEVASERSRPTSLDTSLDLILLSAGAIGLSAGELQARLAALPEVEDHVFLRQLSALLVQGHPFEVRFTVQNSLIVHPSNGWMATNTPMQVIERVCQSDVLASAVSAREISAAQAEERAQRLGMQHQALDVFLRDMVTATLLS